MKLSEKLVVIAEWLENSDNELLCEAEQDEKCLTSVAEGLIKAATVLKKTASDIELVEPQDTVSKEKLEELAAVAASFDESGDELLMKQAAVIDDLLLTLSAPKNYLFNFKKAEEDKIDTLKKKYKDPKSEQDEMNKVSDVVKDLKKSPTFKEYRILEAPLSTRTCVDHPGAQLARIGEHVWQCSLDKKVYNYDTGFTTLKGNVVPGGGVEYQTPNTRPEEHQIFDTRNSRLGTD